MLNIVPRQKSYKLKESAFSVKELQEEIAFKNRVLEVCPLKEACCCANKNETDNGKQ